MEVVPPAEPLTDGVVELRQWRDEDVPALIRAIDGDPEISAWLELIPQPYGEAEARSWIELAAAMWRDRTGSPFAVVAAGGIVGGAGVTWIDREHCVGDIGYWLRREARGCGYTTRAVRLISDWAFDVGAARLQIRADAENTPSLAVAERAGFLREGTMRAVRFNPRLGRRMNFVLLSRLPDDPS